MTAGAPDHFLTFRDVEGRLVAINRFSISCVVENEDDGHTHVWMQSLNNTNEKGGLRVILQEPQSEVVRMFKDAASEKELSRMSSKLVQIPAAFGEPTAVCPSAIALVKEGGSNDRAFNLHSHILFAHYPDVPLKVQPKVAEVVNLLNTALSY